MSWTGFWAISYERPYLLGELQVLAGGSAIPSGGLVLDVGALPSRLAPEAPHELLARETLAHKLLEQVGTALALRLHRPELDAHLGGDHLRLAAEAVTLVQVARDAHLHLG